MRVVTHAQSLVLGNIASKLEGVLMQSVAQAQDTLASKHWDIPSKIKVCDHISEKVLLSLL